MDIIYAFISPKILITLTFTSFVRLFLYFNSVWSEFIVQWCHLLTIFIGIGFLHVFWNFILQAKSKGRFFSLHLPFSSSLSLHTRCLRFGLRLALKGLQNQVWQGHCGTEARAAHGRPVTEPTGHLGLCLVTGLSAFVPHPLGEQPHRNKGFWLWSAVAFYLLPSQRSGEPGPSPHGSGARRSGPIYPDCFRASSVEEPQAQLPSPFTLPSPSQPRWWFSWFCPWMPFQLPFFYIHHLPLVCTRGRVWN